MRIARMYDREKEDDVAYDGTGVYYVKNQILVSAGKDLTFKDVSEIASKYNADIVGYLEMVNQYQIETRRDVTLVELDRIITELKVTEEIQTEMITTVELYMDYDLFGYYVNSEGEYQRLLLDSKVNYSRSLMDPNSNKICTWFFE